MGSYIRMNVNKELSALQQDMEDEIKKLRAENMGLSDLLSKYSEQKHLDSLELERMNEAIQTVRKTVERLTSENKALKQIVRLYLGE